MYPIIDGVLLNPPVTRIFVSIIGHESDNTSSIQSPLMFPIVDHVSDSRSCIRSSLMCSIIDHASYIWSCIRRLSILYSIIDHVSHTAAVTLSSVWASST